VLRKWDVDIGLYAASNRVAFCLLLLRQTSKDGRRFVTKTLSPLLFKTEKSPDWRDRSVNRHVRAQRRFRPGNIVARSSLCLVVWYVIDRAVSGRSVLTYTRLTRSMTYISILSVDVRDATPCHTSPTIVLRFVHTRCGELRCGAATRRVLEIYAKYMQENVGRRWRVLLLQICPVHDLFSRYPIGSSSCGVFAASCVVLRYVAVKSDATCRTVPHHRTVPQRNASDVNEP